MPEKVNLEQKVNNSQIEFCSQEKFWKEAIKLRKELYEELKKQDEEGYNLCSDFYDLIIKQN